MHESTTRSSSHPLVRETSELAPDSAALITIAPIHNAGVERRLCTDSVANRTSQATLSALSPTELTVAKLVAEGLSNVQAARALCISHRTVEVHLTHIYAKLGLSSRLQLALLVSRHAMFDQSSNQLATGQPTSHSLGQSSSQPASQLASQLVGLDGQFGNEHRNAIGCELAAVSSGG